MVNNQLTWFYRFSVCSVDSLIHHQEMSTDDPEGGEVLIREIMGY